MGHIIRSITLADEIKGSSRIQFITTSDSDVQELIKARGYRVRHFMNDDSIIENLSEFRVTTIIIDRPPVTEDIMKRFRQSTNARIILLDSDENASKWADVAINGLWAKEFKNKKYLDESSKTLHYYGPKYLILREQFNNYARKSLPNLANVRNILLIFGGSDPSNLTTKTLERLLELNEEKLRITVIAGPKFEYHEELRKVIDRYGARECVSVVINTEEIAKLMVQNELVFVSPGLAMFEALSIGLYVIASCQNELQRDVYRYFLENNDVIPEPFHFLPNTFFLSPKQKKVQDMQIGRGKDELIHIILDG